MTFVTAHIPLKTLERKLNGKDSDVRGLYIYKKVQRGRQ